MAARFLQDEDDVADAVWVPPDEFLQRSTAITTDSSVCTRECLGQQDVFCKFKNDEEGGICCSRDDSSCILSAENQVCSN